MNSSGSDDQARGSEEAPPAGHSEECTGNCIHLLFTVCSRNPQNRSIIAGRGGDLDTDELWAHPVRRSSTNKKPAVYLVSRWWTSSVSEALCVTVSVESNSHHLDFTWKLSWCVTTTALWAVRDVHTWGRCCLSAGLNYSFHITVKQKVQC